MNKQEIFDKVYLGLKSQNFQQSKDEEGNCVYRGPNGLKCAAGHIMTDEEYSEDYDAHGGTSIWGTCLSTRFNFEEADLIAKLQEIHDWHPDNMKEKLEEYAEIHKFTVPE